MHTLDFNTFLIPWLGKTAKMVSFFIQEKFRQHDLDLTKEQMILLKMLHEKDGQIQNDLALITDRDKGSLARLINTMEKKNLVARIPLQEDKRVNQIFLTKQGRKTFASALPVIQEIFDELQNGLTGAEIASVIEVLEKVQKNVASGHDGCNSN